MNTYEIDLYNHDNYVQSWQVEAKSLEAAAAWVRSNYYISYARGDHLEGCKVK